MPVGFRRIGLWAGNQAVVLVLIVGLDDEAVALVIESVVVARASAGDQRWRLGGVGGGNEMCLGGNVVGAADYHVTLRRGESEVYEEARVLFLVNDHVIRRRLAETVKPHLKGPPLLVERGVEEGAVVCGPHRIALGVLDDVSQQSISGEILDAQGEAFSPRCIRAVRQQAVVVGDGQRAQAEILRVGGQRRFVENHLRLGGRIVLNAKRRWPTGPNAILAFALEAPLVVVGAIAHRHAAFVRLLAALEFGEDRLYQPLMRHHHRVEVGVLGVQIGQHIGILHVRIAIVLQPAIGVFESDAVIGGDVGTCLGPGRLRHPFTARLAHRPRAALKRMSPVSAHPQSGNPSTRLAMMLR